MRFKMHALFILLFCAFSTEAKESFTLEEQKLMVKIHNEKRSNVSPEAKNMRELEYSQDLALSAQAWANECSWEHGKGDVSQRTYQNFGQNLYASTGTFNLSKSIESWHDEKNFYNYSTRNCDKVCGHYTQVVWAKSFKLGCGVKKCATLKNLSFKDAYYVVCHYHLPGNLAENNKVLHPYEEGAPCSACPSGATICSNKLCSTGSTNGDTTSGGTKSKKVEACLVAFVAFLLCTAFY